MQDTIFDIELTFEGKTYNGWVHPSDKLNEAGVPTSFHVVLNDTSFGHLSFKDCRWMINEERPAGLVKQVGKQIEKHYQF